MKPKPRSCTIFLIDPCAIARTPWTNVLTYHTESCHTANLPRASSDHLKFGVTLRRYSRSGEVTIPLGWEFCGMAAEGTWQKRLHDFFTKYPTPVGRLDTSPLLTAINRRALPERL